MVATLELLDPQLGIPLQSWPLSEGRSWQIGRAPSSDIVISSPFVSRTHASLREQEGVWLLEGLSDKGLFIAGDLTMSAMLQDGDQFQLARKGPMLRLRLSSADEETPEDAAQATVSFDADSMPMLTLDRQQLNSEVDAIARSDYFRNVERLAQSLRRRRLSDWIPRDEDSQPTAMD